MQQLERKRGVAPLPPGQRQRSILGTVVALGLAAFLWWAIASGKVIGGFHPKLVLGIAIGFGLLLTLLGVLGLVACLTGGNRIPRYTVDSEGIALWSLVGSVEVPWSDIRAVGIGFQISPRRAVFKGKQDRAIEIFLTAPDAKQRYPRADQLVVEDTPPRPELPNERIRLVSLETDLEEKFGAAVTGVAADRWLGSYQRRWEPIPGR